MAGCDHGGSPMKGVFSLAALAALAVLASPQPAEAG